MHIISGIGMMEFFFKFLMFKCTNRIFRGIFEFLMFKCTNSRGGNFNNPKKSSGFN